MNFKFYDLNSKFNQDFNVLVCQIEKHDLEEALYIAKNKLQFTMNANQNGDKRTEAQKFYNQLQGTLAEIAIREYLLNLGFKIQHYDQIRTDGFKSPKGEFDLKIICPNDELLIESRSSKIYDLSKISKEPIIGKYVNQIKKNEKDNDLFFQTLFPIRDKGKNFLENLAEKQSFIMSGIATIDDFKTFGQKTTLGQSNTIYNVCPVLRHNQVINFQNEILLPLQEKFYPELQQALSKNVEQVQIQSHFKKFP